MNNCLFRDDYKNKGYVLLKNFLNVKESEFIINNANLMEKWKEEQGKWMIYFEKKGEIKNKTRLENFLKYNKELDIFLKNKIVPLVNDIVDENLILFKEKLNWKLGGGKGFKTHQDHPAWTDFKPDKYITVALFADNSTKEKGCLEFSDYYEKKLLDYEKNTTGHIQKNIEEKSNWNFIETTPKDILIFDSYAPHRSGYNKTNENRRIFYFTFNPYKYGDLYNEYLNKKRNEFPPDIERENNNIDIMNNKYNLANPII